MFITNDPAGTPECRRRNNWVRLHRHRPTFHPVSREYVDNWNGREKGGFSKRIYEGTLAQVYKDHGCNRPSLVGYIEVITHDDRKMWWRTMDTELVVDPGNQEPFFTFDVTFGHQLQQMTLMELRGVYSSLTHKKGSGSVKESDRGTMIRDIFRSLGYTDAPHSCMPSMFESDDGECRECAFYHVCKNHAAGLIARVSRDMQAYMTAIDEHAHQKIKDYNRKDVEVTRRAFEVHRTQSGRISSSKPNPPGAIPRGVGDLPRPGVNVIQETPRPGTPEYDRLFRADWDGVLGAGNRIVPSAESLRPQEYSGRDAMLRQQASGFKMTGVNTWSCPHGHEFEVPRPSRSLRAAQYANTCPECKPQLRPLEDFKKAVRDLDSVDASFIFRHLAGEKKANPKGLTRKHDAIIRMGKKKWGSDNSYPTDLRAYAESVRPERAQPIYVLEQTCPHIYNGDEEPFMYDRHSRTCHGCMLELECDKGGLRPQKMNNDQLREDVCCKFGDSSYDHNDDTDCLSNCGIRDLCEHVCKYTKPNLGMDIDFEKVAATKARGFPCWDGVPDPAEQPLDVEFKETDPEATITVADRKQYYVNQREYRRQEKEANSRYLESAQAIQDRIDRLQKRKRQRELREEAEKNPIYVGDLSDWMSRPVGVPNGIPRKHKVEL